jgi:two-component system sensor kinase FixL
MPKGRYRRSPRRRPAGSPLSAASASAVRLATVLRTTVDGIITINERGTIQDFNPAAENIFGYTAAEAVGRNVHMLMPPPDRTRHNRYIARYLRTGKARIIGIGREVIGRRRDGALFPMDLAVSEFRVGRRRMFTGIVRDVTERRRTEEAIVSVSEEVRRMIGQELHDVLGQQVTALSLLTKTLEKKTPRGRPDLRRLATHINEVARAALSKARHLAHGLYPAELEKHGLSAALAELADTQQRLFRIPCAYRSEGAGRPIPPGPALHLYRIAQEAVNNAVKHAEARRVAIQLATESTGITLTIEDDGVGIPADWERHRGIGLTIMKYRAHIIDAEFEVARRPGGGTRVRCRMTVSS